MWDPGDLVRTRALSWDRSGGTGMQGKKKNKNPKIVFSWHFYLNHETTQTLPCSRRGIWVDPGGPQASYRMQDFRHWIKMPSHSMLLL